MEKLKMQTQDSIAANIEKIAALFPNCITETRGADGTLRRAIDFEALQQELMPTLVSDTEERYQFTWPDKRKAKLLANAPINATLRPCREESVDFDNTHNLYIEGDNLDVLKCLKETYSGKIKMIYIDPPYNTGNDFVYNDSFRTENLEFRAKSGNYDEEGNLLTDIYTRNTESNGRFHTDWLNMIYPRLKVARDLLTDDGVIFISIDDNEVENLRKVCDEVFGELSFVSQFVWKSRQNKDNRNLTGVSIDHEYILCYSKFAGVRALRGSERKTDQYSNPDNDPRGPWTSANMAGLLSADLRPNCHYDLINPETGINYGRPKMGWRYDRNTMNQLISEKRIIWPPEETGRPRRKAFLSEIKEVLPGYSSIIGGEIYTRTATLEVEDVMGDRYFDFPKPSALVKEFVEQSSNKDSIVLDFFSGSATTAHAVMQLNAEDGGNRKFIMVQLPEQTDEKSEAYKAGYKNICEIGKERIRRAGKKIKEDSPLTTQDLDTGFRVLRLDSTNMEDVYYAPQDLSQANLFNQVDNVKDGRTSEDLLFQVMLELGVSLDSKIEVQQLDGKSVYNVADNFLIACFDTGVTDSVITAIAKQQPQYATLRDSSYADDSTATNFEQIFKTYSPNTTIKTL